MNERKTTKPVLVTVNNPALAKALGVKPDSKVSVDCRDGVPVDQYWRNRFKDAVADKSITVPAAKTTTKTSTGDV